MTPEPADSGNCWRTQLMTEHWHVRKAPRQPRMRERRGLRAGAGRLLQGASTSAWALNPIFDYSGESKQEARQSTKNLCYELALLFAKKPSQ
jgi:hypothetical protein